MLQGVTLRPGEGMPRTTGPCSAVENGVLNHANARAEVSHKAAEYNAFPNIMAEASLRTRMRVNDRR